MRWLFWYPSAANGTATLRNHCIAQGDLHHGSTSLLGGSRRRKAWYGVCGALRYSAASAKVKLLMGGRSLSASPRNVCARIN